MMAIVAGLTTALQLAGQTGVLDGVAGGGAGAQSAVLPPDNLETKQTVNFGGARKGLDLNENVIGIVAVAAVLAFGIYAYSKRK